MPKTCSAAPIRWRWESSENLQLVKSRYGGAISSRNRLFGSPLVNGLTTTISATIDPSDQLRVNNGVSTGSPALRVLTGGTSITASFPTGAQVDGWGWSFDSDSSRQARGFTISTITPSCGVAASSGMSSLSENGEQSYALLTGSGDTVFFSYQTTNDQTAIWLEGASPDLDVDLYVATGTLPDKDSRSSATPGSSNEFLDGSYGGQVAFVAVHSRAGSGVVQLHAASRRSSQRYSLLICTSFSPTPNDKMLIEKMVAAGRGSFWGMSEGKAAVEAVRFSYSGCVGCNVCIHGFSGRAYAGSGAVTVFSDEWRSNPIQGGKTLAHEWGHDLLGLRDEYVDHGSFAIGSVCHADDLCFPSAMDDHLLSTNLCTAFAHGGSTSEAHICATKCGPHLCAVSVESDCAAFCNFCNSCPIQSSVSSSWQQFLSLGKAAAGTEPIFTPDNSSYSLYPFPF